jgi:hypothetical protein
MILEMLYVTKIMVGNIQEQFMKVLASGRDKQFKLLLICTHDALCSFVDQTQFQCSLLKVYPLFYALTIMAIIKL